MTPEEQAENIYNSFYIDLFEYLEEIQISLVAKRSALTCVTRIIMANPHTNPIHGDVSSTMEYWMQVRDILRDKY